MGGLKRVLTLSMLATGTGKQVASRLLKDPQAMLSYAKFGFRA